MSGKLTWFDQDQVDEYKAADDRLRAAEKAYEEARTELITARGEVDLLSRAMDGSRRMRSTPSRAVSP